MGIQPTIVKKDEYSEAIAEAAKPKENPFPDPPMTKEKLEEKEFIEQKKREELLRKTEEEQAEENLKFETLLAIITYKVMENHPRLEKYPQLVTLFSQILMYRLENKKNKVGFVKATINQITVGIDIMNEDLEDE